MSTVVNSSLLSCTALSTAAGSLANAASVGANTVNGPGPRSVSSRSAVTTTPASAVNTPDKRAVATMSDDSSGTAGAAAATVVALPDVVGGVGAAGGRRQREEGEDRHAPRRRGGNGRGSGSRTHCDVAGRHGSRVVTLVLPVRALDSRASTVAGDVRPDQRRVGRRHRGVRGTVRPCRARRRHGRTDLPLPDPARLSAARSDLAAEERGELVGGRCALGRRQLGVNGALPSSPRNAG